MGNFFYLYFLEQNMVSIILVKKLRSRKFLKFNLLFTKLRYMSIHSEHIIQNKSLISFYRPSESNPKSFVFPREENIMRKPPLCYRSRKCPKLIFWPDDLIGIYSL